MEDVTVDIDILDFAALEDLRSYFDVREHESQECCVYVTGCPVRIKGWLDLNCYDVDPYLYPELF